MQKAKSTFLCSIHLLIIFVGQAQILNLHTGPKLFYPQHFFDSIQTVKQIQNGNARITGQAFLNDKMDGAKHYASNALVYLLPYSNYLNEWFKLRKKCKNTNNSVYLDPKVFAVRKETYTDDYGNFTFEGLQPGKYYVECNIYFRGKALGSQQTGNMVVRNGYGTVIASSPTYEYFTYRYDGQKLVFKWVDIKEGNFLKEVKLKPTVDFPFLDIEKISSIGVPSPCFRHEGLQTGTCTEYFDNGNIKIVADWNKNFYDGSYSEYYRDKIKSAEGNYKKGYKTGTWKYYFATNGKLKQIEKYEYENGISYLDGEASFYYENGTLKEKDLYKKNKLDGESITYYSTGTIKDKFMYKNGIKHGKCIFYDTNGVVTKEEYYENGKKLN